MFIAACSGPDNNRYKPVTAKESQTVDYGVTYIINGANGVTYSLKNAPPGLSKAEVKKAILRQHPEAAIPKPIANANLFHGYQCTDDCSGHEAGYEWAEEQGISDPDECGGNSMSFEEGCRAYAEEQGY